MSTTSSFVGREAELGDLLSGLDEAVAGSGRLFLVGGEPGIGKSALTDEFARAAARRGARVLAGRCWEAGGAPPYWPWVQSVRSLIDGLDEATLRSYVRRGADDLTQMLPELKAVLGKDDEQPVADPDTARFRLFDSAASFLVNAARDGMIVITLEDLHAADTPSLLFLEFLARAMSAAPIVIVGTYRDVEVSRDHQLAVTLVELARERATRRISLGGLRPPDVERFISQATGVDPSTQLVETVVRETEGNPLFIGEIVRLLASEGRLTDVTDTPLKPIPQGIRDVIARRVGHISERCNHVLGIASVLGREFMLDVLGGLSERPADELLEILDEAEAARLVSETPGVLGSMRFSHSLIRDVLYEELSTARRIRLHRRAGETLEMIQGENPERFAELAHHFFAAAPTGDAARAVHYARAAAEHALTRLAFEEAARLYRMALQATRLDAGTEDESRLRLLLALGDALNRAGDAESARAELHEAAEIARRLGDRASLAHAALGYGGTFSWTALRGDRRFVPLLEEALAAQGDEVTSLRVKLMGRLAAGPYRDSPDANPRLTLSAEAVRLARELGDPETLAYALEARLGAIMGPRRLDDLLEVAEEILSLAVASNDGEKILMSHVWRMLAQLFYGNMAEVFEERHEIARLAERLRQGAQKWFLICTDASLAMFAGRFDETERLSKIAYEAGRRAEPYALFAHRTQMFWLRAEQSREKELAGEFRQAETAFSVYPVWRSMLPHFLLSYGTQDAARAAFKRSFAVARPVNEEWTLGEGTLALAAVALGEQEAGARLYDELLPHHTLTMGGIPDINIGSVSRVLGLLAATLGRPEDAEKHFIEAVEANDRMGARPWAAWARYEFATMMLDRDRGGDAEHAARLLAEAIDTAREVGMATLEKRIASHGVRSSVAVAPGGAGGTTFRREGEYWTVAFGGDAFRLQDTKGLRYVARLLAAPGRELHALDLVAGEGERRGVVAREDAAAVGSLEGDAGELLDPEAKRAYRSRLADLDADIEEARGWGDEERTVRAEEEREALLRQLAGAVGLGGRDRRAASAAERARVNVTRTIKAAVARLAEHSPALGAHLEATLRTGTFCSYTPDPRAGTVWDL